MISFCHADYEMSAISSKKNSGPPGCAGPLSSASPLAQMGATANTRSDQEDRMSAPQRQPLFRRKRLNPLRLIHRKQRLGVRFTFPVAAASAGTNTQARAAGGIAGPVDMNIIRRGAKSLGKRPNVAKRRLHQFSCDEACLAVLAAIPSVGRPPSRTARRAYSWAILR